MKIKFYQNIKTLLMILVTLVITSGCMSKSIVNLQTGNAQAKHAWQNEQTQIELPFTWYDGHIIIELAINDKKHLKFALDSGASATVVFETSRTKGITIDVDTTLDLPGSTVNLVNNAKVQIADLVIKHLTIIHVPIEQSPLFTGYDDAYFDGAIGYDVLKHYVTKIDYQNQKVIFYQNYDITKLGDNWQQFPIAINGQIPYIETTLKTDNGDMTKQHFVVDTGAPDFIYMNSAMVEGLSFPNKHFLGKMKNFEGEQQIKTGQIKYFELAGTPFANVTSHDLPHFKDDYGIGLLGSGLLRKFNVIFDFKNEAMLFEKPAGFNDKTPIDRSGLTIEPHLKGGLVKDVAIDTGAEKLKLVAGDIITHIDNKAVLPNNFDNLRQLLTSKGNSVAICWLNKRGKQCGQLELSNRI